MSDRPHATPLLERLRRWRHAGDMATARACLAQLVHERPADAVLRRLAWEHEAFWWEPVRGLRTRLQRRGPDDAELARTCWADVDFMRRFNRMAVQLPTDDAELRAVLQREQAAIISESQALHWTVERGGRTLGFVSVVNITMKHRRAEFLIGLHGDRNPWAGPEASHLALGFLAKHVGIERLTAHFYTDNAGAFTAAMKLGFEVEGTLKAYLRGADGRRFDLVVAGLILDPAFFERTEKLRRRLLGPAATL